MNTNAFDKNNEALLTAIHQVTQVFIDSKDVKGFYQHALNTMLTLTGSQFGVFSELKLDEHENPFMRANALASASPDHTIATLYPAFIEAGHMDFHDMATLYGHALLTGKPCVCNSPVAGQESIALLSSRHKLSACLLLPLIERGKVLGMVAIANRPGGYSPEVLNWLEPFCTALSCILVCIRSESHCSRIEKQLHEARAAEVHSNEAKNLFLATISHEVRTPMNAIVGMCDLLKETPLNIAQSYFAKVISHNSELLLSIINDVLDVSRLEAGKMELLEREFDLENLLAEVVELLGHRATEKGLSLLMVYPVGLPRHLVGDRARIRQILVNLIDNAIKFTDLGHVLVSVSGNNRGTFNIAVQDTGIGICKHSSADLFGLFHQVDQGVARRYGGTGLGLAISQRVAMLLGGVIQVSSQKDRGSTFSFEFPARLAETDKDPPSYPNLCKLNVHVFSTRPVLNSLIQQYLSTFTDTEVFMHEPREMMDASLFQCESGQRSVILIECDHPGLQLSSSFRIGRQNELLVFPAPSGGGQSDFASLFRENKVLGSISTHFGFKSFDHALDQLVGQAQEKQPETLQLHRPATRVPPPKILLVEDNPINQDVACLVLTQMGCLVDVAFNGVQALEKYTNQQYDLIFMDCQMPLMDGLTATVKIREMEGMQVAKRTPIVAITANALSSDRSVCINAGMDDYLAKPFKRSQVQDVLERFLPAGVSSA